MSGRIGIRGSKRRTNERREGVIQRLQAQLDRGTTSVEWGGGPLNDDDLARINYELDVLHDRVDRSASKNIGRVRAKAKREAEAIVGESNSHVIEIYEIKTTVKNSARRASKKDSNKANLMKSRSKEKTERSRTLMNTVPFAKGLMKKYESGLMGISPKNHVFVLVKKDGANSGSDNSGGSSLIKNFFQIA